MKKKPIAFFVLSAALLTSIIFTGCSQQSSASSSADSSTAQSSTTQQNQPANNNTFIGKVTKVSGKTITLTLAANTPVLQNGQPQDNLGQQRQQSSDQGNSTGGKGGGGIPIPGMGGGGRGGGGNPPSDSESNSSSSTTANSDLSKQAPLIKTPTEFTGGEKTITITDNTSIMSGINVSAKKVDITQITSGTVILVTTQTDQIVSKIQILQQ